MNDLLDQVAAKPSKPNPEVKKRSVNEDINNYFSFVDRRIERVSKRGHYDDEALRYLIALSLIDALSTVAYPESKVSDRFTKAVLELADWDDANRVSRMYLARFLELAPNDRVADAEAKYNSIPKSYRNGILIGLSRDPMIDEVETVWPLMRHEKEKNLEISLFGMTHASLLYQQRNYLVHEQRDGMLGQDFTGGSRPYYYVQRMEDLETDHIVLAYPIKFVINLCSKVAEGTKQRCVQEHRSPYENFSKGHFVYSQLDYA